MHKLQNNFSAATAATVKFSEKKAETVAATAAAAAAAAAVVVVADNCLGRRQRQQCRLRMPCRQKWLSSSWWWWCVSVSLQSKLRSSSGRLLRSLQRKRKRECSLQWATLQPQSEAVAADYDATLVVALTSDGGSSSFCRLQTSRGTVLVYDYTDVAEFCFCFLPKRGKYGEQVLLEHWRGHCHFYKANRCRMLADKRQNAW